MAYINGKETMFTPIFNTNVIDNVEIAVDFSNGNITESLPEGYSAKSVTIFKPDTLIPENIAEGVTIAGIVGTHKGGGGAISEPYVSYGYDDSGAITTAKLNNFTEIPASLFEGSATLKTVDFSNSPNITSIGNRAFYNCQALENVQIPDTVTSIGEYAFYQCAKLKEVTIPNGVTVINNYTFSRCISLNKVIIPDTVTTINMGAFSDCNRLYSVTLGSGLTKIVSEAFEGCSKLVEIYNRSSLTLAKGTSSNGYVAYRAINIYTPTSGVSKLLENDNYVFIADNEDNYILTLIRDETVANVTLPESVTINGIAISAYIVGYSLLNSVQTLVTLVIPDTVTEISDYAFYFCDKLTTVTIGNGVNFIGKSAFSSCSKLTSATFADTDGWYVTTTKGATSGTAITSANMGNVSTAATNIRKTYASYYWYNT